MFQGLPPSTSASLSGHNGLPFKCPRDRRGRRLKSPNQCVSSSHTSNYGSHLLILVTLCLLFFCHTVFLRKGKEGQEPDKTPYRRDIQEGPVKEKQVRLTRTEEHFNIRLSITWRKYANGSTHDETLAWGFFYNRTSGTESEYKISDRPNLSLLWDYNQVENKKFLKFS